MRKGAWDNFCTLKFIEACFVLWCVAILKNIPCAFDYVFYFLSDVMSCKYQLNLTVLLYHLISVSILIRCLEDLSIDVFSSVAPSPPTLCDPMNRRCQASLSITNCQSLPKPMSIELVMPSNHLILCCPLFLLPSIFPSIRVFSNESALHIRWPKYWSFSFNISPSMNTQDSSPLGWTGWISLQSNGLSRVFSNTTVQKHQFFGAQLSL